MEAKTKNKQTRQQIVLMTERAFPGLTVSDAEDAISEMTDGWFNASYSVSLNNGRTVVLKIAPPADAEVMTYEKNMMATEVAMMRLVKSNPAIPVPEIYFVDTSRTLCDADYFFMEMMPGENLGRVKEGLPKAVESSVDHHTGQILRWINEFEGTFFGFEGNPALRAGTWREAFCKIFEAVLQDGMRKQVAMDFSHDEIQAVLDRHLDTLDGVTKPSLVHWDAWQLNLFVEGDRVCGIIDFERALWGDPLMELQFRRALGESGQRQLAGYGWTVFTAAEERRRDLYSLYLALVMITECAYRHYDSDHVHDLGRAMLADAVARLNA